MSISMDSSRAELNIHGFLSIKKLKEQKLSKGTVITYQIETKQGVIDINCFIDE